MTCFDAFESYEDFSLVALARLALGGKFAEHIGSSLTRGVMPMSVTSHHGFDTTQTIVDGKVFERQDAWSIYVVEPDGDAAKAETDARQRQRQVRSNGVDWALTCAGFIVPVLMFCLWIQR